MQNIILHMPRKLPRCHEVIAILTVPHSLLTHACVMLTKEPLTPSIRNEIHNLLSPLNPLPPSTSNKIIIGCAIELNTALQENT